MIVDPKSVEAIWTSSCPRCLRPGKYKVVKIYRQYYVYVDHGRQDKKKIACYLAPLEDLPNRYPSVYRVLVKLASK